MPEKSCPGIWQGLRYISGHDSVSRMIVEALMRISRSLGEDITGMAWSMERWRDDEGAGLEGEYESPSGEDSDCICIACIIADLEMEVGIFHFRIYG